MPSWINSRDDELAGGRRARKEVIRAALQGSLPIAVIRSSCSQPFDDYLKAKKATANTNGAIEFDRERLEVVKRMLGDVRLSAITRETIEGFQAKRRLDGASNRTVNMDVGALRQVLKRFKQWRRLEDDVKMLTESGGAPIGRVLTREEQKRLFEVGGSNPEWEHVYCAARSRREHLDARRRGEARPAQGRRRREPSACSTSVRARTRRASG